MKIIYYCHTGNHTSLIAAAVHLGLLPIDRIPEYKEMKRVPFFDEIRKHQIGTPFYMGDDKYGHKIYSLGLGFDTDVMEKALRSFIEQMKFVEQCKLVNTFPATNKTTLLGSFVSAVLGWKKIARFLVNRGIGRGYGQIKNIVIQTQKDIKKMRKVDNSTKVIPFPVKKVKKLC